MLIAVSIILGLAVCAITSYCAYVYGLRKGYQSGCVVMSALLKLEYLVASPPTSPKVPGMQ